MNGGRSRSSPPLGDFNANAPTVVGSEVFPKYMRTVDIASNPLYGIAMRVNPGAITPTALHTFEKSNRNSLHSCELVDTLTPGTTTETIFPGTNTGAYAPSSYFHTESGGAPDFSRLAKFNDDTTYLETTSPSDTTPAGPLSLGYHSLLDGVAEFTLGYRGNRASKYTAGGKRVVSVTINARIANLNSAYSFQFGVGILGSSDGHPNVVVSPQIKLPTDGVFRNYSYTLPGDPWALASVRAANAFYSAPHYSKVWDDIVTTGGPYSFGIVPINPLGSGASSKALRLSGLWLTVTYCTENRRFASYPRAPLAPGWNRTATLGPAQRQITFSSNSGNTSLTTPGAGTNGAGDFTANDVGAKIIRASDGQVVGTIS